MKSNRLSTLFLFCLMVCFSHFHSAGLAEEKAAEEKAPETIKAGLRARCDGLPVRNLSATITLVNPQNGKEYKCKGKTDREGSCSFSIPAGKYECRGVNTGWYNPKKLERERSKATMIVDPGGERFFNTRDYFNGSKFWTSRKRSVSLGPECPDLPDLEFVPKFEIVYPDDGSRIQEQFPVFRWKSVGGAKSYTVIIRECRPPEIDTGKRWKQILREESIPTTEWRPDTPLFNSDMLYLVEIVAKSSEGTTINQSKKAEFTIAAGDVTEPQ